jgi:hypothetical protein
MDKGSQSELTIERMPHGGFIVILGRKEPGFMRAPVFASSTIDESLQFIRDTMNPVPSVSEQAGS